MINADAPLIIPTPAEFEAAKIRLENIINRINELGQRLAEMREVWNE